MQEGWRHGCYILHGPWGAAFDMGAWCGCPPLSSPAACLPTVTAGRGLDHFPAPAGRMPLYHARALQGLEVGIGGRKRKAFCKVTPYDNCPVREDKRVTTWSLCTHLVCLGFRPAPYAPPLLLQFAALSPGLSCSSLSIYLCPHQTSSSCVF